MSDQACCPPRNIERLLETAAAEKITRRLDFIYNRIPMNNCRQCADCCFNCLEVSGAEFLNIYLYLSDFPNEVQKRLSNKLIEYELLNLTTLETKCPFLEDNRCLIYARRALQCRLFGLYPRDEYSRIVAACRKTNKETLDYYRRRKKVLLPPAVVQYDVDQCENNIQAGKKSIITAAERDLLHAQISAVSAETLPREWGSDERFTFSRRFARLYFPEDELENLKITCIKEYQEGKNRRTLDGLLADCSFSF